MTRMTIVLLLALASTATADPKLDQARTYFERGKTLYAGGDYKKAVEEYLAAYKLASFPELIFNIGQAYRLSGNGTEALKSYELFLQQQPTGELADEARAHVLELRSRGGTELKAAPNAWETFNANVVIEKPRTVDLRPRFAIGASATAADNMAMLAASGTYVRRLGQYFALAPRVQLGRASSGDGAGVLFELQGRAFLLPSEYFFLGAGLAAGYSGVAGSSNDRGTAGGSMVSLFAELGFVISAKYEVGLHAGMLNKATGPELRMGLAAAYRL